MHEKPTWLVVIALDPKVAAWARRPIETFHGGVNDVVDVALIVVTGEGEVVVDGETFTVAAGQALLIPKGREHTFRVVGDKPSRHLLILTPGGFEGFFADMAQGGFRIPEDMPAVLESAARHHLTFTGPPI